MSRLIDIGGGGYRGKIALEEIRTVFAYQGQATDVLLLNGTHIHFAEGAAIPAEFGQRSGFAKLTDTAQTEYFINLDNVAAMDGAGTSRLRIIFKGSEKKRGNQQRCRTTKYHRYHGSLG